MVWENDQFQFFITFEQIHIFRLDYSLKSKRHFSCQQKCSIPLEKFGIVQFLIKEKFFDPSRGRLWHLKQKYTVRFAQKSCISQAY